MFSAKIAPTETARTLHVIDRKTEIIRGPLEIENEETWVYFSDPDGNVLEYIEWYK